MGERLTEKQERVLKYLIEHIEERGYPPTLREIARRFRPLSHVGAKKHLLALERKGYIKRGKGARELEVIGAPRGKAIPIVGRVAAGKPILAIENIDGWVSLDPDFVRGEEIFLLRVKGDSMVGAHILDGDLALVRPQSTLENGEVGVVVIDNEATVKRFFKDRKRLRLQAENPEVEPIVVERGKEVRILGKVVGLLRWLAG